MELFRLCHQKYAHDLSGYGASRYGGRWNPVGTPVVYTAQSRSLALAEMLVRVKLPEALAAYAMMVVYAPDELALEGVDTAVHPDWRMAEDWTQRVGHDWAEAQRAALLRVPSAVVRSEYNYLLNPVHPASTQIRVIAQEPIFVNERLFQR